MTNCHARQFSVSVPVPKAIIDGLSIMVWLYARPWPGSNVGPINSGTDSVYNLLWFGRLDGLRGTVVVFSWQEAC